MDVANLLLRITGDNAQAKRSLREIAEEVRRYAQIDAEAHLRVGGTQAALAQIDRLNTALTIVGQRDVTAKVKVKIEKERDVLAGLRRELEHSIAGGVGSRDRDSILRDIEQVGARIALLGSTGAKAMAGISQGFISFGSAVGSAVVSLGGMGLVAGVVFVALSALLGVIMALVTAFALAVGGALALATALVAVFVPILVVAIAGIMELTKVIKAAMISQADLAKQQEAVDDAVKARADATEGLAKAQRNLKDATTDAYRAWEDAVEDVDDAIRSVASAEIGLEQAHLNVDKAKNALDKLKSSAASAGVDVGRLFDKLASAGKDPAKVDAATRGILASPSDNNDEIDFKQKILDYKQAVLGVADAEDRLSDSQRNVERTQQRKAEFIEKGIKAYGPYIAALEGVESATERLADSEDSVTAARTKQAAATKGMSDEALKLVGEIRSFIKEVKTAFGPAIDGFLKGIGGALESLGPLLSSLSEPMGELGESLGGFLSGIAEAFSDDRFVTAFEELLEEATQFVEIAGPAFSDFLYILLSIALAAMPLLLEGFGNLAGWLADVAKSAEKGDLDGRVRKLVKALGEVWDLLKEMGGILVEFFKGAEDPSRELVRNLTRMARRFKEFLATDEGRAAVKKWIQDSVRLVGDLVELFKSLIPILSAIVKTINKAIDGYRLLAGLVKSKQDERERGETDERTLDNFLEVINSRKASPERKAYARDQLEDMGWAKIDGEWVMRKKIDGKWKVIKRMAAGGIATRATFAEIGEAGREAVIPLRQDILRSIGHGILASVSVGAQPVLAGAMGGGGGNTYIEKIELPPAPGHDQLGDPRVQAIKLGKELRNLGGGSNRG